MTPLSSDSGGAALVPELTAYDKRVLSKLDEVDLDVLRDKNQRRVFKKSAWKVAEELREYDVAMVRRVLDGLVDFHHASASGWGHTRTWWRWKDRG